MYSPYCITPHHPPAVLVCVHLCWSASFAASQQCNNTWLTTLLGFLSREKTEMTFGLCLVTSGPSLFFAPFPICCAYTVFQLSQTPSPAALINVLFFMCEIDTITQPIKSHIDLHWLGNLNSKSDLLKKKKKLNISRLDVFVLSWKISGHLNGVWRLLMSFKRQQPRAILKQMRTASRFLCPSCYHLFHSCRWGSICDRCFDSSGSLCCKTALSFKAHNSAYAAQRHYAVSRVSKITDHCCFVVFLR